MDFRQEGRTCLERGFPRNPRAVVNGFAAAVLRPVTPVVGTQGRYTSMAHLLNTATEPDTNLDINRQRLVVAKIKSRLVINPRVIPRIPSLSLEFTCGLCFGKTAARLDRDCHWHPAVILRRGIGE